MKKIIALIIILTTALFITGCGNKITSYTEIDYSKFSDMIDNKEDFILFIGSSECSHCKTFEPKLEKLIKEYQLDVKYINVYNLSEKEYAVLQNKTKFQGTPTVVFIEDGVTKTTPKIVGDQDYEDAKAIFIKSGYIEGE